MGRLKNMAVMLLIMAAMVLFSSISVFASGFSVTVPLSLPIQQTSDGELVFAEGLVIKNNCSTDDVKVTNISLTNSDGWSIIDYSAEPSESGNEFALKINGSSFNADGSYPLVEDDWVIPNNSSLDLSYSAKTSLIEEGESVILGNVVFTVDIKPYEVEIPDDADDYYVPEENLSGDKASSLWVWYTDTDDGEAHITNYLGTYSDTLDLVVPTTLDGAPVVSMEAGNFADKTLKSLYVPSGVKIKDSTWTNLTAEKIVLNGVTVGDSGFRRHNIDSIYATDSTLGEGAFYVNSDSTNVVSTLSLNNTSVGTSCFYYNTFDDVIISDGSLGQSAFYYTTTNNKFSLLDGAVILYADTFANRSYPYQSAVINYLYIDIPVVPVKTYSALEGAFENCSFEVVEFGPSCSELGECSFMSASITTIKGLSNLKTICSQAIYNMEVATTIEPATLTDATIKSSGLQGGQQSSKLTFESLTLDNCSVGSSAFYLQTFNDLTISNSTLYQYAFGGIKVNGQCNVIENTVFKDPLMFTIHNEEEKTTMNKLYVDAPVVPTTNTTQYNYGVFKSANVTELELGPNCTEVARYSFAYLKGLSNIKGLNYLKKVDEYAFSPADSYTISDEVILKDATIGQYAFSRNNASYVLTFDSLTLNNCSIGAYAFARDCFGDLTIKGDSTVKQYSLLAITVNNEMQLLNGITFSTAESIFTTGSSVYPTINRLYVDTNLTSSAGENYQFFNYAIVDELEFGVNAEIVCSEAFRSSSLGCIKSFGALSDIGSYAFANLNVALTIDEPLTLSNVNIGSYAFYVANDSSPKITFSDLTLNDCIIGTYAFSRNVFGNLIIEGASTVKQYSFVAINVNEEMQLLDSITFSTAESIFTTSNKVYPTINRLYIDTDLTSSTTGSSYRFFNYGVIKELEFGANANIIYDGAFSRATIGAIKSFGGVNDIGASAFASLGAALNITDAVAFSNATIGNSAFNPSSDTSNKITFSDLTLDSCTTGTNVFQYQQFGNLTVKDTTLGDKTFYVIDVTGKMELLGSTTFAQNGVSYSTSTNSIINDLYVDCDLVPQTGSSGLFQYSVIPTLEFGSNASALGAGCFRQTTIDTIKGLSNIKTFGNSCFYSPNQTVSILDDVILTDATLGTQVFYGSSTKYFDFGDVVLDNVTLTSGNSAFYYSKFNSVAISNTDVVASAFSYTTIPYLEIDSTSSVVGSSFSYSSSAAAKITDAVIDLPTIPAAAFRYCGISMAYLGDNVTTVEINAFYDCAGIEVSIPAECTYVTQSFAKDAVITVRDGSEAETLEMENEEVTEEEATEEETTEEEVTEEPVEEEVVEEPTDEPTEETPSDKETGETPVEDGTDGEDASDEGTSGENTSNEDTSNGGVSNEDSEGNQNPETSGDDGVSNTTSGEENGESGSDATTEEIVDGESNSGESSGESTDKSNEGTSNDTSGETTPDDESGDVVVEGTETEGGNTTSEPVIPDNVGEDNVSGDETSSEEPVIDDTTSSNGEDEGTSSETTESETDTSVTTPDENKNIESEGNETEIGVENVETPAVEENVSESDSTTSDEDGEFATENTSTPEVPASTESASNETSTSGETTSNSSETTSKKALNGSKETEVSSSSTPAESVSEAA